MKAFIASVFVRNLISTILMGSGTPGLQQPCVESDNYEMNKLDTGKQEWVSKSIPDKAFKWRRFKASATQKAFYVLWQGIPRNSLQKYL
jgi:hypothetical protein